jgi:hypothetical protein
MLYLYLEGEREKVSRGKGRISGEGEKIRDKEDRLM